MSERSTAFRHSSQAPGPILDVLMVAVAPACSLGSLTCRAAPTSSWWARGWWARRARTTWPSPASACAWWTGPTSPRAAPAPARATCSRGTRNSSANCRWRCAARTCGSSSPTTLPDDFEYDRKGSVVVAETEAELIASAERARVLAGLGVHGEVLDADALRREEPYAAHDLPGRRPVPRRRAARAAPGHRRAGPRRRRAGRRAVAGHQIDADRARAVRPRDRRRDRHGADHGRRRRRRRRRVDEGPARDLRPARAGHAPQGPDRRARALARRVPAQAERGGLRRRRRGRRRRPADRDGRRVHAVRHRAARLLAPARRLRPRASTSPSPARSPPAPPASSRSSTTPARCASTPGCAR